MRARRGRGRPMPHRGKVVGLVCHHRQRLREQAERRCSQAGCVPARGQQAIGARRLLGSALACAKGNDQDSRGSSGQMTTKLPISSVLCQKVKQGMRQKSRSRGRGNNREVYNLGVGEGRSREKDEGDHNRDRERHRRVAIGDASISNSCSFQGKNNFIQNQCDK